MRILDWTRDIERNYKGNKGTVLAAGPIMLEDGCKADWSECDEGFIKTKHPRSAIYTTRDGKTVLLTVDGRSSGNAAGMSIPELMHLRNWRKDRRRRVAARLHKAGNIRGNRTKG